ncbi:hypothetical protein B0A49_13125 [Cryomyces minteri]|uniref:dolichol kinase n=1 Tax=Cryomyces minteri TaxID=331657 RepID=A0A4U0WAY5_9PEZI|nr:hypothetical protein B0A49_13125 [Cryomyces minteri]
MFVACGHVLRWGVALARIPRWRLRRAGHIIKARNGFLNALGEGLQTKKRSLSLFSNKKEAEDSDADEDQPLIRKPIPGVREGLKLHVGDGINRPFYNTQENATRSAIEPGEKALFTDKCGHANGHATAALRQRRYTLPNLTNPYPPITTPRHSPKHTKSSVRHPFLSLTPTQATIRKWAYAAYVYVAVVLLIAFPIRLSVKERALQGHEPVGWALGYLFGGLQPFRFWVVTSDLGLDQWIPLPPFLSTNLDQDLANANAHGWADLVRKAVIGEANTRLLIAAYWLTVLSFGLLIVQRLTKNPQVEVDTRRKVFHGTIVLMLLPTIFIDPCFVALALGLVLTVFLLLDLLRASQLPPLSKPLSVFLTPYVDGRDLRGPVVVSHIFLLVGCAIPLWLSMASYTTLEPNPSPPSSSSPPSSPYDIDASDNPNDPWAGWNVPSRDLSMLAGVICVGLGDAAASLIGRRFGRRKWPWAGGKSLEGSAAFATAVTVGLVVGKLWLAAGWDNTPAKTMASEYGG